MSTQVLRGKIEPLALIDVLAYLGRSRANGALRVSQEKVEKSIIISDGSIVFARSNQAQDRLGDTLLAHGLISQEQYDEATALTYEKGIRHGRALVEVRAISPKQLWQTVQNQIRGIAASVIPWQNGSFEFFRQPIKNKESITLMWPIMDMIQDVIRNLDDASLFKKCFPDDGEVMCIDDEVREHINLEPYEQHIMHFIDGNSSVADICDQSDYGQLETLRVLYLLKSLGWVRSVEITLPIRETHPMVKSFNHIFAYLHGYLTERVGAVGVGLMKKYFEETARQHPLIFEHVTLSQDGTLNPVLMQRNLQKLDLNDSETLVALDDALNEYLNVCILAVTRLLGAEHQTIVVEKIAELV